MMIMIDLEDDSVAEVLTLAAKKNIPFNQFLKDIIDSAVLLAATPDTVELDDAQIDAIVSNMIEEAKEISPDKNFLVPSLYSLYSKLAVTQSHEFRPC
jgi:hypothetical protein